MRVHLITDPDCGHLIAASTIPELATRHADVSGLAGYPTATLIADAAGAVRSEWPSTSWECPRCLRRLDDTLRILFRQKVILVCDCLGVEPAGVVHAYDRLEEERPDLMHSQRAGYALAAAVTLAANGELTLAKTPDWDPSMFTDAQ
jgi:hypothetical protein